MSNTLADRISALDWGALHQMLDDQGFASLPVLLSGDECREIIATYEEIERFRVTIQMARYRFGIGEYKYYQTPLPALIQQLRSGFYPELAIGANRWLEKIGRDPLYPASLPEFLEQCHREGQSRPTPLILKYEAGGYNCLHQDLYGEIFFPFQVVIVLTQSGLDYTGGEFLLVEQRPRAQSRGYSISLEQGAALIFPTHDRPVQGSRGYYKATLRHGVSTILSGTRYSLGIIFHDAT